MANAIKYKVFIGPRNDLFGVKPSGPNNAVIVCDNSSSDFSLSEVIQDDDSGYAKRIFEVSSSTRKTKILSNTSAVKMTNVVDLSGNPLFFKIRRDRVRSAEIHVNGRKLKYFDANFLYTNLEDPHIEYIDANGNVIFEKEAESIPVFIWEGLLNHSDLIALDKRSFSYRESKGKVLISANKPDVIAEVNPEPVFVMKKVREHSISIEPFLIRNLRAQGRERAIIEYDYLRVIPNKKNRKSEQVKFNNKEYLELENGNIIKSSVVIYKIDGLVRTILFDNTAAQSEVSINSTKGRVYAKGLLIDGALSEDDILLADYQYLSNNLTCTFRDYSPSEGNNEVHFQICPTRVKNKGFDINYKRKISYTITTLDGDVVETNDENVPITDNVLNFEYGWGHRGYSEGGFGGIRTDFSDIEITYDRYLGRSPWIETDGPESAQGATGYGANGYGMGPFGGSNLSNINQVKNLLDIRNDSKKACISIGSIRYEPSYSYLEMHEASTVAIKRLDGGHRRLRRNSGIIWSASIDNNYIESTPLIDQIKTRASISFNSSLDLVSSLNFNVSFDISELSGAYTAMGEIDDSFMLSSLIDLDAFTVANSLVSDSVDNVLTGLAVFMEVNLTPVHMPLIDVHISADLKTAYAVIQKNSLEEKLNIGLGYVDESISIPPTRFTTI